MLTSEDLIEYTKSFLRDSKRNDIMDYFNPSVGWSGIDAWCVAGTGSRLLYKLNSGQDRLEAKCSGRRLNEAQEVLQQRHVRTLKYLGLKSL